MNRRTALRVLAASAAGFALDPERLLWTPSTRTIFLPPAAGWCETVRSPELWPSIRLVRSFDVSPSLSVVRVDVLYGVLRAKPPRWQVVKRPF